MNIFEPDDDRDGDEGVLFVIVVSVIVHFLLKAQKNTFSLLEIG